jgi:hypothetical protein
MEGARIIMRYPAHSKEARLSFSPKNVPVTRITTSSQLDECLPHGALKHGAE